MTMTFEKARAWSMRLSALAAGAGLLTLSAGLALASAPQERQAQTQQAEGAQQQDLPSAEEVLKKYVDATGGAEAYQRLRNQHAVGKFSMPAMGMEGKFELFQQHPDKFLALITLEGMGEIQTGLNGKSGWRTDPMQGPRLLEGEELKSLTRDADMQVALEPMKYYESIEVQGVEEVNGERAYRLLFKPKDGGSPSESWYSVESGLQLKSASTQETPMGEMKFENTLHDYKELDGDVKLKQPHRIVTSGGGTEYVVTLEKVETNIDMPANRFEPPADVKQLMEQQQQ